MIGAALQTLKGHSDIVYSVVFSPDSKQVVSGSVDRTVRLWDTITGEALQTLKGHSVVASRASGDTPRSYRSKNLTKKIMP